MWRSSSLAGTALLLLLSFPARSQDSAAERDGLDLFEKRIRPVLVDKCYSCHSAGAEKIKGNLVVDTREGLLKGGDTGPSLLPGHPDKSLLIKALKWSEEEFKMPPKKRLSPEVIADFETWIRKGAPDPRVSTAPASKKPAINVAEARHAWPFTPLAEPAVPPVADASWARGPIDRFLLAKLDAKGLQPAPDADKRT